MWSPPNNIRHFSILGLFLLLISIELIGQNITNGTHYYFTINDTTSTFDPANFTETFKVVTDTIYETADVLPIHGNCIDLEEIKRADCSESEIDFHLMIGVQLFYEAFPNETKEGMVWTRFFIDKSGKPNLLETNSTLDTHFETKATELITGLPRWVAGKIKGKNVNVVLSIPIRFQRIIKKK